LTLTTQYALGSIKPRIRENDYGAAATLDFLPRILSADRSDASGVAAPLPFAPPSSIRAAIPQADFRAL
jgi:hypothetical protein